jgi:hypothetical protein
MWRFSKMSDKSEVYLKYERQLEGIPEVKGDIKNVIAFEMLYEHFVNGVSKSRIADIYTPPGGDRSYALRILAKRQGTDTSRRAGVRNVFHLFMKAINKPSPFEEYHCPPSKRKKRRPGGFGLLKG